MTSRIALLGAAAALVLAAGAQAQPYGDRYDDRYDNARVTYDRDGAETIIARPDRDYIEKHTRVGHINGEVDPTAYSISRQVDLADLDLSQPEDRQEMRNRVYETAVNLCYELDARVPGLHEDESADKECVRTATRDALRDVRGARYRD